VVVVTLAAMPREESSTLADGLRALWPLVAIPVLLAVLSTDQVWARTTARALGTPGGVDTRVDESGVVSEQSGVGVRFAWPAITTVAESDEMVAFLAENGRRLHIVALSRDHMTAAQAAAVLAHARQAPGERRWVTVRSRGTSPRLRVVPGPAEDAPAIAPGPLPDWPLPAASRVAPRRPGPRGPLPRHRVPSPRG